MSTRATPTIFCFSDRARELSAIGEAITSKVSIPASAIVPSKSSKCTIE